jgi:RNA polymerase sigma-B factor
MTEPLEEQELLALFDRLPDDRSARDELVARFMPLAEYLARRFAGRGEPLEDLTQVATVGLLGAVDRFDPSRGVPFSTFAAATIVGELKRHLRDKAWAVRVPRRLQELGLLVGRTIPELTQRLGRGPTIDELADAVEADPEEVLEAMDAMSAYAAGSLDAPTRSGDVARVETIGAEDPSMELVDAWTSIAPAVADLPERERRVLYLRFFRGMTQSEIADVIGVSQMHISRILSQTLERIRIAVGPGEPVAAEEGDAGP